MGDSAEYEIFVRPDAVERALLILADHADLPARAPTTVRLPDRRRVTLPFATNRAGRTIADCSLGADLELMLSLRVDADELIVDRYNLFPRSLFADIDGATTTRRPSTGSTASRSTGSRCPAPTSRTSSSSSPPGDRFSRGRATRYPLVALQDSMVSERAFHSAAAAARARGSRSSKASVARRTVSLAIRSPSIR